MITTLMNTAVTVQPADPGVVMVVDPEVGTAVDPVAEAPEVTGSDVEDRAEVDTWEVDSTIETREVITAAEE